MILSGKSVEGDPLPMGVVRKTMLGKPVALVREYSFCTVDEETAVELGAEEGCGECIEGHIKCDRFISSVPMNINIIDDGDTVYVTLATAPKTALLLSGCYVRRAGGEFFTFVVPTTRVHNTGGGTSDVREDALERMRIADRGGYTEKEEAVYSDYCKLVGPGRTHKATVAMLMEKYDMKEPMIEAIIRRVEDCLK